MAWAETYFFRGICAIEGHVCVGTSSGDVLFFILKGGAFSLKATVNVHQSPVCVLAACEAISTVSAGSVGRQLIIQSQKVASSDENGSIAMMDGRKYSIDSVIPAVGYV